MVLSRALSMATLVLVLSACSSSVQFEDASTDGSQKIGNDETFDFSSCATAATTGEPYDCTLIVGSTFDASSDSIAISSDSTCQGVGFDSSSLFKLSGPLQGFYSGDTCDVIFNITAGGTTTTKTLTIVVTSINAAPSFTTSFSNITVDPGDLESITVVASPGSQYETGQTLSWDLCTSSNAKFTISCGSFSGASSSVGITASAGLTDSETTTISLRLSDSIGAKSSTKTFTVTNTAANYFGDASDGVGNFASNTSFSAAQDGDVIVKNFSSLTIDAGVTVTLDNRAKGMLVYVQGDATINGILSMTARGANADPVAAGVPVGGLKLPFLKTGGLDTLASGVMTGAGSTAVSAIANHVSSGSGVVVSLSREGGAGAVGVNGTQDGANGTDGTTGQSGGGGAGGTGYPGANSIAAASGAAGTVFSGGAGGGGSRDNQVSPQVAQANGGVGGFGSGLGNYCVSGGAGNPGGTDAEGGGGGGVASPGSDGTGGLLILVVGGNLTLGAAGKIESNGSAGGDLTGSGCSGGNPDALTGAGSGGGIIVVVHAGTLTNSGSIEADGGRGGLNGDQNGGTGGAGSIQIVQVDPR